MRDSELGKVGKRIREIRRSKNLNLHDVASKSDITAGLLSRIENFRTMPSLPVLHGIANALGVSLADLVEPVGKPKSDRPYILIRKGEGETEEREDSKSLLYKNLFSAMVGDRNVRVNTIEIAPHAYRPPLSNDGFEILHVLQGALLYGLNDTILELHAGDTLFFDGHIPHSVENKQDEPALIFKVYMLAIK